ncbi:hypothetical protein CIHG_05388 [Coccidioides immitis H538.4]|uniref:Uncharacterized protein n=1 Tax=Coccidioides immitis H538.4 TaxID=396776 RepID=A0A0J8UL29_COCIT|nr:hypothetical protein CIHG_05388 [Coccidioides immitis H538.4]
MSLGNKARELVAEDVLRMLKIEDVFGVTIAKDGQLLVLPWPRLSTEFKFCIDANPGWHTIDAIDQINGILRAHCRSGKLLRRRALEQGLNNFSTIYDEPEARLT